MDTLSLGLESLLIISVVAYLAPYIASLIPGRPIPEAVFLVFAGAFLGSHGLNFIDAELDSIQLMSQLGCAFLFLMAGYEIEVKKVTGPMGRHASTTWLFSLLIALALVPFLPLGDTSDAGRWAFALAMTTTAYGTLAPILRDRGLEGTPVGDAVTVYGATGEVLPVLAMGILLSTRGTWISILSIAVYLLICFAVLLRTKKTKERGSSAFKYIGENAESGAQAPVRAVVVLLVFLVATAYGMHLDIVVGAFAAGFILRALVPRGNKLLEGKLDAIAFGFFVPLFFIVSGTTINLAAVGENPLLFIGFIGLLLLVRALPVLVSLRIWPESRALTSMESFSTSMYCVMALPLIVAVTSVAVDAGAMTESMASVLVTGGAFTVLAVPLITAIARKVEAAHPVQAVQEIAGGSADASTVVREHYEEQRNAAAAFREARAAAHAEGRRLSSADFLASEHRMREERRAAEKAEREAEKAEAAERKAAKTAEAADAVEAEKAAQAAEAAQAAKAADEEHAVEAFEAAEAAEAAAAAKMVEGAKTTGAATPQPAVAAARPAAATAARPTATAHDPAASRYSDPKRIGFLRVVEIWFVAFICFVVVALVFAVREGVLYDTTDIVLVLNAVFDALGFWLIARRKRAARSVIIGFSIVSIVVGTIADIAVGFVVPLTMFLESLPAIFLILYFSTSKRVKAQLTESL